MSSLGHLGRTLPEACAEYFIFLLGSQDGAGNILGRLESIRKAALELSHCIAEDYVWYRDEFNLEVRIDEGKVLHSC